MSQVQRVETTNGAASMPPLVMDQGANYRAEIFNDAQGMADRARADQGEGEEWRRDKRRKAIACKHQLRLQLSSNEACAVWSILEDVYKSLKMPEGGMQQSDLKKMPIIMLKNRKTALTSVLKKLSQPTWTQHYVDREIDLSAYDYEVLMWILKKVKKSLYWCKTLKFYMADKEKWRLSVTPNECFTLDQLIGAFRRA